MSNYNADIIIIGGGPAGISAAIAAKKAGAEPLLIEKAPFFGGMATGARVHSMLTFHSKNGYRIIGGVAQEVIDRLKQDSGTPGHILDTVGVAYSVTPTDPDRLTLTLHKMLDDYKVNYMLEAKFTGCKVKGRRIESIAGISQSGKFNAKAPIFIDASGEGSLAAAAGCSFEQGRNGSVMPCTLIFQVTNINFNKIFDYAEKNPGEFHYETRFPHLRKSPAAGISGFFSIWQKAKLSVPRDRILFYAMPGGNDVGINSTRVPDFNPLDPKSINIASRKAREQVYEIYAFFRKKKVPGFEHCRISSIAPFLGVREVRRIKGRYILKGEDLAFGRRFKDEIALGGFPIDIHIPNGAGIETGELGGEGFYGIPYGSILAADIDNLLICGKCFSAEFEAHASARVQATSMAMGHAAGIAAAISTNENKEPADIDPEKIREIILQTNGILEPEIIDELS